MLAFEMEKQRLEWSNNVPLGLHEVRSKLCRDSDPLLGGDRLQCCFKGCKKLLLARGRNVPGEACPEHHVTIGPLKGPRHTYVYGRGHFEKNFIVATDALRSVIAGKRETHRLGNENSEDALSWNVFVGFLALDALSEAFEVLAGTPAKAEIELYLWGHRIRTDGSVAPWVPLRQVQEELELKNWLRTRRGRKPGCTEPDVVLRDPDNALVVIEAKLSSGNSYLPTHRIAEYIKRYVSLPNQPDPLNRSWMESQQGRSVLGQLVRNVIFASRLAKGKERPIVVNLVRDRAERDVESRMKQHLSPDFAFLRRSWESIFRLPILQRESARPLRAYVRNKTVSLQRAFDIQ